MLEVVITLEISSELADGKEEVSKEYDGLLKDFSPTSLMDYSRDDWTYIKESIEYIQTQLIRKDANAGIGDDVENDKSDTDRGRNALYCQDRLIKRIVFQEVFANLRLELKDQLDDETLGGKPNVDQAIFDQLM